MKFLFTAAAFVISLILMAIAASFALIFLVGPHGGVLPQSFYVPALVIAWIAVLGIPVVSARWMWRYLAKLEARKSGA